MIVSIKVGDEARRAIEQDGLSMKSDSAGEYTIWNEDKSVKAKEGDWLHIVLGFKEYNTFSSNNKWGVIDFYIKN